MNIKRIIAVCLVGAAVMAGAQKASALGPFKFGVKAGATVNEFKFNEDMFDSSNRCGFTAGLTTKFVVPVVNLGFDLSLMYTQRSSSVVENIPVVGGVEGQTVPNSYNVTSNYIEIPLNLRYEIGIPLIGKFVVPYLTTGPDFSFLLSKENASNAWDKKKFDFAWNVGFGLLFMQKVQVHASYGFGLNNAASQGKSLYGANLGDAKNRFWSVTAAYYF